MVIAEEDGREKRTGVEVVEKLFPVSVTSVSKESEACVLCAGIEGTESTTEATSAHNDGGSIFACVVVVVVNSERSLDDIITRIGHGQHRFNAVTT
jgi:hypothetical protein